MLKCIFVGRKEWPVANTKAKKEKYLKKHNANNETVQRSYFQQKKIILGQNVCPVARSQTNNIQKTPKIPKTKGHEISNNY